MRIVVLDGHTLNPGDLSWDALNALGEVTLYERTSAEQIEARARDAEAILTNKAPLDKNVLSRLPRLRYIGVTATGYNIVDVEAAVSRGICVTHVPTYGTDAVAQFTFALLLALCHRVQRHHDAVMEGAWTRSPDFSFTLTPQIELSGKTFGIVGYGRIGRRVAKIAFAFGMEVLIAESLSRPDAGAKQPRVPLETLLASSDVVSLHCPLTPHTQGLIRKETLARMKRSAFLINTARGPLVVEEDLAEALNEGRIAGAALDVLSVEPPPADNPLLSAKNCLITPHMARSALEARARLLEISVENLRRYAAGDPINTVVPGKQ